MKMSKTLTVLVLLPALIFGVSACSGTDTESEPVTTGTASASAGVTADPGISGAVGTVEGLYSYMTVDENLEKLNQAEEEIPTDATNEQAMETLTNSVPDAFSFYDTSTYEKTISAYRDLTITGTVNSLGDEVIVDVPEEAVTIDGETATVDNSKVVITVDGSPIVNTAATDGTNLIHLNLINNTWLIDASHE